MVSRLPERNLVFATNSNLKIISLQPGIIDLLIFQTMNYVKLTS